LYQVESHIQDSIKKIHEVVVMIQDVEQKSF